MSAWRDHRDEGVARPEPPGADEPAFYAAVGDHQGDRYRRNAFARHTGDEVDALHAWLRLAPDHLVLDVGCADGRHLRSLAERGVRGLGVDVSTRLVAAARRSAAADGVVDRVAFVRGDARRLPVRDAGVNAAICVMQGGLGTHPDIDRDVVAGLARAVRPGGRLALTFFHALFAARNLAPGDALDPVRLVHHQVSEVRGPGGRDRFDLWSSAYTAREAAGLVSRAGLEVEHLAGCEPGRYDAAVVRLDDPELLLVCRRP